MEGCLFRSHRNVDLAEGKADVAEGGKKTGQGQLPYIHSLTPGMQSHDTSHQAHNRKDQTEGKQHFVSCPGILRHGSPPGHEDQHKPGNQQQGTDSSGYWVLFHIQSLPDFFLIIAPSGNKDRARIKQ